MTYGICLIVFSKVIAAQNILLLFLQLLFHIVQLSHRQGRGREKGEDDGGARSGQLEQAEVDCGRRARRPARRADAATRVSLAARRSCSARPAPRARRPRAPAADAAARPSRRPPRGAPELAASWSSWRGELDAWCGGARGRRAPGRGRRGGAQFLGPLLENGRFGCVILVSCVTQMEEWVSDLGEGCWRQSSRSFCAQGEQSQADKPCLLQKFRKKY